MEANLSDHEIDLIKSQWSNVALIPWTEEVIKKIIGLVFGITLKLTKMALDYSIRRIANLVMKLISFYLYLTRMSNVYFSCMNIVKNKNAITHGIAYD